MYVYSILRAYKFKLTDISGLEQTDAGSHYILFTVALSDLGTIRVNLLENTVFLSDKDSNIVQARYIFTIRTMVILKLEIHFPLTVTENEILDSKIHFVVSKSGVEFKLGNR
jgi:hypothetical protein